MDERVADFARVPIPREQAVPIGERPLELFESAAQVLGRVVVVMQMDLDLAEPGPAQLREPSRYSGSYSSAGKKKVCRGPRPSESRKRSKSRGYSSHQ